MTRLRPSAALPFLAAALLAGPAFAEGTTAGVQACRACHPRAVAVWEKSPHARAEGGLGARANEPACKLCHAPLREAGQVGVTCEACHGPGAHYAKAFVMRDRELARAVGLVIPGNRECRTCHDSTSPSLEPFDFATKLKLIEHGRADREARKPGSVRVPGPRPEPGPGTPPRSRPPAKLEDGKERR